jgi:hypothetical protein
MVKKKFSIGYQLPKEDSIPKIVSDFEENIAEVYFAFPGDPSGRISLDMKQKHLFWEDINILKKMDVALVLLFNAACYGENSMSKKLIDDCTEKIRLFPELKAVTTVSPFIAKEIKKKFPELEIRASTNINMKMKTIRAMEYLADYFDGYYIYLNDQRNIDYVRKVSRWSRENKKKLHLLANCGCLYDCPFQFFHITILAHGLSSFSPPCGEIVSIEKNKDSVLCGSWIRPEDIHNYEAYFDTIKLATRINNNPRMIIESYIKQKYYGNLLDIMEPVLSNSFKPDIINNQKFPKDWFEKTSSCERNCDSCIYCKNVFEKVKSI